MANIDEVHSYMRFLKLLKYARHTVKSYSGMLKHFVNWLNAPLEQLTSERVLEYLEYLGDKGLAPKTINGYLDTIRGFYEYLRHERGLVSDNPVKPGYTLRLPRALPRFLSDAEIAPFFRSVRKSRDKAKFLIMLRCGLRVEEVADLTIGAVNFENKMIKVLGGKWGRDRVVYMSDDASHALKTYLPVRPPSKSKGLFLVEKGIFRGKPISVRGIQKRIEYYSCKTGMSVSCLRLRHTMANQLLNADAMPVTIQELLGHNCLEGIQRYCRASNPKVRRDHFKAMETVLARNSFLQKGRKSDTSRHSAVSSV